MKKISFVFVLICSLVLAACSSSDKGNETPIDPITQYKKDIIGKWVFVGNKPSKSTEDYAPVENFEKTFIFNDDNTCRIIITDNTVPKASVHKDINGTYIIRETTKGVVVRIEINGLISYSIIKFSDNKRILYMLDDNPDGYYATDEKYIKA